MRAILADRSIPPYRRVRRISNVTAPAIPPSPSGQPMPVGDLPGWTQIFTEDFRQDIPLGAFPETVSAKWWAYPYPWPDTSHNGRYDPHRTLSAKDGILNIHIHTENGEHLVAAPVPSPQMATPKRGLLYGRYAIRFRADPLPGYKTAWLLWPDSEAWPSDGEIDFPEGNLNSTISGFVHHQDGTSPSDQTAFHTDSTYSTWHTAIIEWTPGLVRFILDGVEVGKTTERIPNSPMHWVIQTETQLSGGPPADSTEGNVQIDWASIYTPSPPFSARQILDRIKGILGTTHPANWQVHAIYKISTAL